MSLKSEQLRVQIGKKYWDLETCRKSYKNTISTSVCICSLFNIPWHNYGLALTIPTYPKSGGNHSPDMLICSYIVI